MAKPVGHLTDTIPAAHPISWRLHQGDLNAFVVEVLGTLGKEGTAVWYPLTAYTLRMVQAARWRLWRQGGCAIRCRTDVEHDRIYVRADFSTARAFTAWTRQASLHGARWKAGKLRVLQGGKSRKRARAA